MRAGIGTGLSFGLTSGVITTLGLMVGLNSGTSSQLAVIGGILTIAFADALSDALGMHVAKESEGTLPARDLWVAAGATFAAKLLMACTFLVPVLLLELDLAILAAVAWGLGVLAALSYVIARAKGERPAGVIAEHVAVAVLVIAATHLIGEWVAATFGRYG